MLDGITPDKLFRDRSKASRRFGIRPLKELELKSRMPTKLDDKSDKDPVKWLFEANNLCKLSDVHPDKLFKKSGNLTATKLLSNLKDTRLHKLPKYVGIISNLLPEISSSTRLLLVNLTNQRYMDDVRLLFSRESLKIDEEELRIEEDGCATCESSHPTKRNSVSGRLEITSTQLSALARETPFILKYGNYMESEVYIMWKNNVDCLNNKNCIELTQDFSQTPCMQFHTIIKKVCQSEEGNQNLGHSLNLFA
ncbi:hypothetical protein LXL04_004343 [Taraxacum kok-saghyz]